MTKYELTIRGYRTAQKRLLLLDYDGTLAGFSADPSAAEPSARLLQLLQKLAKDRRNTIVIISGRDQATLEAWLGRLPINLVAEHGYLVKNAQEEWRTSADIRDTWKGGILPIMAASIQAVAGSFVEEKITALVWHYRNAKNQRVAETERQKLIQRLQPLARKHGLAVMPGNKIVEVKPKNINKGQAARTWLAGQAWDFVLAAGDDTTDEDMFKTMPKGAFTIKIGPGGTAAKLALKNPGQLLHLLSDLSDKQ